jgi:Coenzyme PQQ synthesis protein D (PqqD)
VNWEAYPRPVAGIQVNEVTDGYVVYDPSRERVHYLNHTAVLLLELCTGQVKARDLPALLQKAYGLPEPPVAEVADCLEKLLQEGLVS